LPVGWKKTTHWGRGRSFAFFFLGCSFFCMVFFFFLYFLVLWCPPFENNLLISLLFHSLFLWVCLSLLPFFTTTPSAIIFWSPPGHSHHIPTSPLCLFGPFSQIGGSKPVTPILGFETRKNFFLFPGEPVNPFPHQPHQTFSVFFPHSPPLFSHSGTVCWRFSLLDCPARKVLFPHFTFHRTLYCDPLCD